MSRVEKGLPVLRMNGVVIGIVTKWEVRPAGEPLKDVVEITVPTGPFVKGKAKG